MPVRRWPAVGPCIFESGCCGWIGGFSSKRVKGLRSGQHHLACARADFTASDLFIFPACTPQHAKLVTPLLRSPEDGGVFTRRSTQAEKRTATAFGRVKIGMAAHNLEGFALARLTVRVEGSPTRAVKAVERHILIAEALESHPVDGDGGV